MGKKYLIIVIVYAFFVFWLSIQPITEEIPDKFPYQDKVLHIGLYAILSGILALGMIRSEKEYLSITIVSMSIFISTLYGFFLEVCQIFVPTRSFDWLDVVANFIGSLFGVILGKFTSFIISKLQLVRV